MNGRIGGLEYVWTPGVVVAGAPEHLSQAIPLHSPATELQQNRRSSPSTACWGQNGCRLTKPFL